MRGRLCRRYNSRGRLAGGLRRGIVRGYIAEVSVWGKTVRESFLRGVSVGGGSLSGRLCAGAGYSVVLFVSCGTSISTRAPSLVLF